MFVVTIKWFQIWPYSISLFGKQTHQTDTHKHTPTQMQYTCMADSPKQIQVAVASFEDMNQTMNEYKCLEVMYKKRKLNKKTMPLLWC